MRVAPRLLLITDPAYDDDVVLACVRAVAPALPAGAFGVQLRDKRREPASLRAFAERLRAATREVGALFVVNGNPALARDVEADGVHLGEGAGKVKDARAVAGKGAWVSVAAHGDAAVSAALRDGADAVLVSPIFAGHGKGQARGTAAIARARSIASGDVAVYALGGVSPANTAECVDAGADGVAVIRALLLAPRPADVARAFHTVMQHRAFHA